MPYTLDFDIYYSEDRLKEIKKLNLNSLSKKELENISNYIFYGKDKKDDKSIVDRKEIEIKPKFSSFQKSEPLSLEALMENPSFDESLLSKELQNYKKVKPSIDKEKAEKIPEMKELWKLIDHYQAIIDQNTGKTAFEEGTPHLSRKQLYLYKHYLIDLRKHQYYLMDSYYPTTALQPNRGRFFSSVQDFQLNFPVLPRGLFREENDKDFQNPRLDSQSHHILSNDESDRIYNSGKPFFDFRNKSHLYQLVLFYWDIKLFVEDVPDSLLNNLLWTLDFYIEKANLSPQQKLIIEDKKLRLSNKAIATHLKNQLGFSHQENYISTIWNKILLEIIKAVEENFDELILKDYDKAWRRCSCCGKEKLLDSRNFVKKKKSLSGFIGRCKVCDKKLRTNKEEQNGKD